MFTELSPADQNFLMHAIELSRRALEDQEKTLFGAIVVVGDKVVSEGASSVTELRDPTAHAEVMALRNAGANPGRHLFEDGVMYSSSEPCPMCLVACYWARLPRLVFGAMSYDVGTYGFEDLRLYRELTNDVESRSLREDSAGGALTDDAAGVLRSWSDQLPEPVVPKL